MVNISHIIDSSKESTTGGSVAEIHAPLTIATNASPALTESGVAGTFSPGNQNIIGEIAGRQPKPVPAWKHLQDWFLILVGLPFFLPLMLLIAAWIKIVSRGPVIFRQTRIGLNEKPFTLLKFRTMKVNSQHQAHHKYFRTVVKGGLPMTKMDSYTDKRLIPGGWFLRVTGLDELPQLLNVLVRNMSLVGPRPCLPEEMTWYDETQRARFECLPGVTGFWQVNGKNATTFEKMIELDTIYVKRMSLLLDIGIILMTLPALISYSLESRRERNRLRNVPLPLRPDTVRIE
jgi:lipopolysaccharide/colanic/teichoic acid biosynthesis glycosyltransferase